MDTPSFCGNTCHVMNPEYTAYKNSLHARVACVDCHIGPGESWLVKSKISGVRQVFAVLFNTYERPISAPIKNLRPARETCERCHWPQRFSGDLIRTYYRYSPDEQNTEKFYRMIFKVGGPSARGKSIHWHVGAKVWYLARDEKREDIAWVGVEDDKGGFTEYFNPAYGKIDSREIEKGKRLMDCIDCHNRATHDFRPSGELVNEALASGEIDKTLPYIKALSSSLYREKLDLESIEEIREFYKKYYPQIYADKRDEIEKAIKELRKINKLTNFPEMNINSRTYPSHLSHSGCFRCHGKLVSEGNNNGDTKEEVIDKGCTTCHSTIILPGEPIK